MSDQAIWGLVAAGLFTVFYLVSFPLQAIKVRRLTGDSPRLPRTGRAGWVGYTAVDMSLVTTATAALLAAAGLLPAIGALDGPLPRAAGLILYAAGFLLCRVAQRRLGVIWRAGVRQDERNPLITSGPFVRVRNPFFTGWIAVSTGVALLSPSVGSLLGVALLLFALNTLTRGVEEPYLSSVHGAEYDAYRRRAGRFLPRLLAAQQSPAEDVSRVSG